MCTITPQWRDIALSRYYIHSLHIYCIILSIKKPISEHDGGGGDTTYSSAESLEEGWHEQKVKKGKHINTVAVFYLAHTNSSCNETF